MAKVKSIWHCNDCGHKHPKWGGQCTLCGKWDTLVEEMEQPKAVPRFEACQTFEPARPIRISEVKPESKPRYKTNIGELDRLVGGGIVPGSLTLVGGHPGIGKSTLLMQTAQQLAAQGLKVLYVCGEESIEQTSMRARRLGISSDNVYLLAETLYSRIRQAIESLKPDIIIVDSIQIVYKGEISSSPGSVSQVRETTTEFMHLAKGMNISIILVGHVTKSGEIAGPKVLEHLVDTVLYFEGDKDHNYRMVRVVKNRFGATDEVAVFQMTGVGLKEVTNPSQIFLEERKKDVAGSVIVPTLEGSRPILVEIQALITPTAFPSPTRKSTGVDQSRLALLLAVLEKRMRMPLHQSDVFVSVVGGMKVVEPAVDIGILVAIASSMRSTPIDPDTTLIGEVGLSGELRSVPRLDARLKEAKQMGFKRCVIPEYHIESFKGKDVGIELIGASMVDEALKFLIPFRKK